MIFIQATIDTEARVIEIRCQYGGRPEPKMFISISGVLAVLHACSDSRAATLKIYSKFPTFGNIEPFADRYINWEKDVVFFVPTALGFFRMADLTDHDGREVQSRCRNLGFDIDIQPKFALSSHQRAWAKFKNVERVILIRDDTSSNHLGLLVPHPLAINYNYHPGLLGPNESTIVAWRFLVDLRRWNVINATHSLKECVAMNFYRQPKPKPQLHGKIGSCTPGTKCE